jgi:uncharacterized protein (TIRG00374 family)
MTASWRRRFGGKRGWAAFDAPVAESERPTVAREPALDAGRRRSARAIWVGVLVGIPTSALLLWLAVRKTDVGDVWHALSDARPEWVALALFAIVGVYAIQAHRWRRISTGAGGSLRRYLGYVVGGVACNNVLPGRLGDLFRARWLSLDAGVDGGRALATVLLDRAGDFVALAIMFAASVWFVADAAWLPRVAVGTALGLAAVTGVVAAAWLYATRRSRERRTRRGRVRRFGRDTIDELARAVGGRLVVTIVVWSLLAWSSFAVAVWAVAASLGIELTTTEAVFTTAVLNLGVAIPSSPGFVGTYQWLGVAALAVVGIESEPALAFAILMHASWYVPTTGFGGGLVLVRALRRLRSHGAGGTGRS